MIPSSIALSLTQQGTAPDFTSIALRCLMLRLSFFCLTIAALSSVAAANCVYEGKNYSSGAVGCVPDGLMSMTSTDGLDWAKTENDPLCIPGACVNNGNVFSPGGVYTRNEVTIRCEGGEMGASLTHAASAFSSTHSPAQSLLVGSCSSSTRETFLSTFSALALWL
jgi:hypothetical protein